MSHSYHSETATARNSRKVILHLLLYAIVFSSCASKISTNLSTLYLQNDAGNPQLDNLITKSTHNDKLIVQFYYSQSKRLSIGLWPASFGNINIDTARVERLQSLKKGHFNLKGHNIFLGDQQIDNATISRLRNILNDPNHKYIFFRPRMITGNHVVYDISSGSTLDDESLTEIGTTNPSPPKDAF